MKDREVKRMKSGCKHSIELPEEICVEIVSRLPFRSIVRFKAVCRSWREIIETEYFRRKFMIAHRNSSSSWSIMHWTFGWPYEEVVGFYGCERYGIPLSLNSYIQPQTVDSNLMIAFMDGLVLLQTISSKGAPTYKVGNPVLNQWVQLPPHPSQEFKSWVWETTSLVTRVVDGVVVEYKVVFMKHGHSVGCKALRFEIYSSETGKWIRKRVKYPPDVVSLSYRACLSLNKKLHWVDEYREAFVAYDFFDTDKWQKCRVIPFPDDKTSFGRTYSTSGGFLVYISKNNSQLKLWRLQEYTKYSGRWKLMHNMNLTCFGIGDHYFPLAMHPLKTHIIYMSSTYKRKLVSIDLKTHKPTLHNTKSSTYHFKMYFHYKRDAHSSLYDGRHHKVFYAPQFILPQWMESVPPLPSV